MPTVLDLRKEMEDILREYGHWVMLLRSSRKIRCKCWNERAQEADSRCTDCLGSGWLTRAERHLARRDNASQIVTLPSVTAVEEPGRIWTQSSNFFFRHDVHPQVGDLIMEVGWRGSKPTNIYAVYLIQHSEANRGQGGRIEFYEATCRGVTLDVKFQDMVIRSWGPVPAYSLAGGDRP